MKKVTVRVPLRADLAGGTLDLWPLYLFHETPRTVNVAIAIHAECEVVRLDEPFIEVSFTDDGYNRRYSSLAELKADPKVALVARAVEHFGMNGVRIVTRTDAPRGSGLGGSSALAIALVRGLSELEEAPVDGDDLIALVRDLETRLLQLPAGVQDYYPPVYGGLAALHLDAGRIQRHPITMPLGELAPHFILHYSEVAHFSGTNNWEIYKRHLDGDLEVREGLAKIAEISVQMEHALESRDMEAAAAALDREWEARKKLVRGISTPEIDAAISAARKAGAWAGKVCGAGGGGCVVILTPAEARAKVLEALASAPGRTLEAPPVLHGLSLERSDDQAAFSFSRRSRTIGPGEPVEQLYLRSADEGTYRPFVLAEGSVTFDEPRIGVHHNVVELFVAPVDTDAHSVDWSAAFRVDGEQISLSAVPDPGRQSTLAGQDWLSEVASDGEANFRMHLRESERLTVFHNPELGLYSEVHETRETFLSRCLEVAERQVSDQAERLESTFRRRFDQMRERSERDQRDAVNNSEEQLPDTSASEVAISWGQTLHNLTSGRPVSTEAPQSVTEADYLGKITQLQKVWERELQEVREEQERKARTIEELVLAPQLRNIEVLKFVILWASSLQAIVNRTS
jgi:D-glycero-alpha-D-manno-heptose-7-phosphate kinase